jgi:hypothetical protein
VEVVGDELVPTELDEDELSLAEDEADDVADVAGVEDEALDAWDETDEEWIDVFAVLDDTVALDDLALLDDLTVLDDLTLLDEPPRHLPYPAWQPVPQ